MIKLKSVIYLISMMTLAGCSGQKQASVAVEEQSGQWILGPFVRPEGVNPVISPQPTTFQCPMRKQPVRWEESDTFNPAATVKDGKIVDRKENIPYWLCGKYGRSDDEPSGRTGTLSFRRRF